jgi:hypothetical protein
VEEENKSLTTGSNGSWIPFILATLTTAPFAENSILYLMAVRFNMPVLLDTLRWWIVLFSPFFLILAILGLIFIGFALKQRPKTWPILILYALTLIGNLFWWVLDF